MIKRFATLATAGLLAAGALASAADAAGPHQVNRAFSLNTYYGVTSGGTSTIPSTGRSATVSSWLLDRTDGHCGSLQARTIFAGGARGAAFTVVTNCSSVNWAWGSRQVFVAPSSTNTITGIEARICQTNSAGAQTGVCTQFFPINI